MRLGRIENCIVTNVEPSTTTTGKVGSKVTVLVGDYEYARFLFPEQAAGIVAGSKVTVVNRGKSDAGYLDLSIRLEQE